MTYKLKRVSNDNVVVNKVACKIRGENKLTLVPKEGD